MPNHTQTETEQSESINYSSTTKKSQSTQTAFVDNRSTTVAQRQLQETADNSPQVQKAAQLQAIADQQSSPVQAATQEVNEPIVQKKEKDIPAPNKEQVLMMDMLNQRNHQLVKKYKMESKGTHGTNWMHAISIMQGIKAQIPQDQRTSDVTPEDGGFFVDISASGEAQSHDFAKMAAYGTPEQVDDQLWMEDYASANQQQEQYNADHEAFEASRAKTRRAIILEIWGQKDAKPEPRKKHQQGDEDIYKKNAHLLVATLKDSL